MSTRAKELSRPVRRGPPRALPARYGGFELDLDAVIEIISRLDRGCGSTARRPRGRRAMLKICSSRSGLQHHPGKNCPSKKCRK